MRTAALMLGIGGVAEAKETAGIVPLINIFISTVIVLWKYLKIDNTKTLLLKKVLTFPSKMVVAFAATTGFGDNFINPFAVAIGAVISKLGY